MTLTIPMISNFKSSSFPCVTSNFMKCLTKLLAHVYISGLVEFSITPLINLNSNVSPFVRALYIIYWNSCSVIWSTFLELVDKLVAKAINSFPIIGSGKCNINLTTKLIHSVNPKVNLNLSSKVSKYNKTIETNL